MRPGFRSQDVVARAALDLTSTSTSTAATARGCTPCRVTRERGAQRPAKDVDASPGDDVAGDPAAACFLPAAPMAVRALQLSWTSR